MELIFEMLINFVGDVVLCDGADFLEDAQLVAGSRRVKLWVRLLVFSVLTLIELGLSIGLLVAGVFLIRGNSVLAAVILFFLALLFFACWVKTLSKFVKGLKDK